MVGEGYGTPSQPGRPKRKGSRQDAVPVDRGSGETAGKSEESSCSGHIYTNIGVLYVHRPALPASYPYPMNERRLASLLDPCRSRTSAGPAVSFFLLAETLDWSLAVLVMDLIRPSLGGCAGRRRRPLVRHQTVSKPAANRKPGGVLWPQGSVTKAA